MRKIGLFPFPPTKSEPWPAMLTRRSRTVLALITKPVTTSSYRPSADNPSGARGRPCSGSALVAPGCLVRPAGYHLYRLHSGFPWRHAGADRPLHPHRAAGAAGRSARIFYSDAAAGLGRPPGAPPERGVDGP